MRQRTGFLLVHTFLCVLIPVTSFRPSNPRPEGVSRKEVLSTLSWALLAPSAVSASVPLFIAPWGYPSSLSASDVMDRLAKSLLSVQCEILERSDITLKAKSTRNFGAVDELSFEVNEADRVIAVTSQQISGPELNGIAGQKNRLREIQASAGFVSGEEVPPEGVVGQLKAFYGYQSGSGFEDVFLDE